LQGVDAETRPFQKIHKNRNTAVIKGLRGVLRQPLFSWDIATNKKYYIKVLILYFTIQ
jgi:hypothetical protein